MLMLAPGDQKSPSRATRDETDHAKRAPGVSCEARASLVTSDAASDATSARRKQSQRRRPPNAAAGRKALRPDWSAITTQALLDRRYVLARSKSTLRPSAH